MININFDSKALSYEQNALVQKSASKILLDLLRIKGNEAVLDLGCGPGNITKVIGTITTGKVLGVDISKNMIDEASKNNASSNVSFSVKDSENIGIQSDFDVIYCNSAFQWFKNPHVVLKGCFDALKPNGRIGVQAPATSLYCPNFVNAINKINGNTEINNIYKYFKNPWFFLETAEDYKKLFESSGFKVTYADIVTNTNSFTPDQVYNNFQSGAENGYLNKDFYSVPLTDKYISNFQNLVRRAIDKQTDINGMVDLQFKRIYLVAYKI